MRKVVWLGGLLMLAACNTPYNPNLLPGSLAGSWSGSISSAGTSLGSLRVSLTPGPDLDPSTTGGVAGWTVNGSWSMVLPSVTESGALDGKGTGPSSAMHFTLHGDNGCSIELIGTRVGGTSLGGTYTASSCPVPDNGTFSVTKQ